MPNKFPGRAGRLWLLALALLLAACSGGTASPASVATSTLQAAASPTIVPVTTAAPAATVTRPAPTATVMTAATKAATTAPTTGAAGSPTPDPAVEVVLAYLDARIKADVEEVTALVCQAWKAPAVTEAISFRSMNAQLEDVACLANGSSGGFTLVGCSGKMITTYGNETREWDLSSFVYQTLPEDGVWKMCGYH
jgi:hypothetical protein